MRVVAGSAIAVLALAPAGVAPRRPVLARRRNWSIRKTFRVCADPHNLPFSNEAGEGFENKLAELFASKLGEPTSYTYYPQVIGFVRNTLNALRCDVIMGVAVGDDLVQTTNPYYRTTYALVFKPGNGLDGIESLEDPRLKGKHIGVIAGTPPATVLVQQGLMALAKPYALTVDTRDRSAGADDGRGYRGRTDRCRRAVGSDRRLLCPACRRRTLSSCRC